MDQSLHQESTISWSKVRNKGSRPLHEDTIRESKLSKEDGHWLHPTTTQNRFSALSTEEAADPPQQDFTSDSPKAQPIFVSDVTTIPPLIQLLDQTAFKLCEIKALAHNQVKIQSKTPDTYRAIIKALTPKNKSF
jgi:hypothetical protein